MYTWSLRYALGAVVSGEAVTGWREMVTPPPGEFIILEANGFPVGVSCPKDERLEIQIESLKGERGEKGEKGEPGVQGERGPQGIQGEKGEMGPKGDPLTFDDLTSAQKAELKGEKGDTGPQGSAGPQGERGERGPEGIAGATGPQGIQGDTGPRGPKGDTFTFADLSPEQLESLRGPKGNTGATGAKGDKGDTGLPGKIQSLRVNGVDIEPDENGVADIGETTVIDDTQIDGKPWSSKRIVDTLCPQIEKTGTLVQMDGLVEGYPLGVKVSWTPTQEGSGDPEPGYTVVNGANYDFTTLQEISITPAFKGLITVTMEIKSADTDSDKCMIAFMDEDEALMDYMPVIDREKSQSVQYRSTSSIAKVLIYASDGYAHSEGDTAQAQNVIIKTGNIRPIQGRDSVMVERCGKNLINPKTMVNKFLSSNGELIKADAENKTSDYIRVKPNTQYAYQCGGYTATLSDWTAWFYYQDNQGTISAIIPKRAGGENADGSITGDTRTFTTPADCKYLRIGSRHLSIPGAWAILEKGGTPTGYVPYAGESKVLALPDEIYGGEVNENGAGQETWGYMDSYAGETLPAEWICDRAAYAVGTTPPNGAQVAYKLGEPKSFTATGGAAIPALSGVNNVLTDADGMTVTGRADPIKTIANLSNRIAALEASATGINE